MYLVVVHNFHIILKMHKMVQGIELVTKSFLNLLIRETDEK